MTHRSFATVFPRGLIVSCQAIEGEPLDNPAIMAAFAAAAEQAGAVGIRANAPENIRAIRARTDLPILGIRKGPGERESVRITTTCDAARAIAEAGAHAIAIDATNRPRPGADEIAALIACIHEELRLPVVADVSTRAEGLHAAKLGADAVATTLSGYTADTMTNGEAPALPDLDLVTALTESLEVPVIAEGRFASPDQVAEAFRRGAHAVVVGTAITRPDVIAAAFVQAARAAIGGA